MEYRSLIIFLFLLMTSVLRSQEILQSDFEKRLFSDASEMMIRKEADKFKNEDGNIDRYAFLSSEDSVTKYKLMRSGIIKKACDYIGVSYCYGQSSEKGFDCSGFVKFIFQNFGLILPHSSYMLYKISKHIETTKAQSGDLVFFVTRGNGVSHVGIYLGNNQFIHSPGKGRTVSIDSLDADYYKSHLVGFGSVF